MKISFFRLVLLGFLISNIVGIYLVYEACERCTILEIKENVTSVFLWESTAWRLDSTSYAKIENGIFKAMAHNQSGEDFGTSLIQQGDAPHNWVNSTARLVKEITIYRDKEQPLILDFCGKRTSQIEWFTDNQSNRGNNIGILLIGDVGLDYYNNDTSHPRALYIDIWLDTNPQVTILQHWPGVKGVENDYHSGFPEQTMPEVGKEYNFKFRIDQFIRESLSHWNLTSFTLKMVQCYIEARASKGSMEVSRVLIGTP